VCVNTLDPVNLCHSAFVTLRNTLEVTLIDRFTGDKPVLYKPELFTRNFVT
jgi:Ni2+-binding GTPase involved in maturation of urease and hydrogenase